MPTAPPVADSMPVVNDVLVNTAAVRLPVTCAAFAASVPDRIALLPVKLPDTDTEAA